MKNIKALLTLSAITLGMVGCSNTPQQISLEYTPGSCKFENGTSAPDWLCAPDDLFPADYWFAKGTGKATLNDVNLQYTVAEQNARIELARRATNLVEDSFNQTITTEGGASKDFVNIERVVKSKVTTEVTLPATYKAMETYDSDGNLYVLLKVNAKAVNELIETRKDMLMREFNAELKRKNLPPIVVAKQQTQMQAPMPLQQ